MGFPRQEYWSGLPFSSPGDLPNPRMEPRSPALTGGLFTTELPGKPNVCIPLTNSYVKILTPLSDSIRRWDLRKGLGPALMNGTGPLIKKPHRAPKGFPGGQTVKSLPVMQETRVQSLGWEDSLEKEWRPTPVFLPGEFHGQRSLAGYSPWGRNELDTTEQLTLSPLLHRAPEPHAPREDAMRSRQPATSKRALTRA